MMLKTKHIAIQRRIQMDCCGAATHLLRYTDPYLVSGQKLKTMKYASSFEEFLYDPIFRRKKKGFT